MKAPTNPWSAAKRVNWCSVTTRFGKSHYSTWKKTHRNYLVGNQYCRNTSSIAVNIRFPFQCTVETLLICHIEYNQNNMWVPVHSTLNHECSTCSMPLWHWKIYPVLQDPKWVPLQSSICQFFQLFLWKSLLRSVEILLNRHGKIFLLLWCTHRNTIQLYIVQVNWSFQNLQTGRLTFRSLVQEVPTARKILTATPFSVCSVNPWLLFGRILLTSRVLLCLDSLSCRS